MNTVDPISIDPVHGSELVSSKLLCVDPIEVVCPLAGLYNSIVTLKVQ